MNTQNFMKKKELTLWFHLEKIQRIHIKMQQIICIILFLYEVEYKFL